MINKAQNSTCNAQEMHDFKDFINFIIESLCIVKPHIRNIDKTNTIFSVEAACAYDNKRNETVCNTRA